MLAITALVTYLAFFVDLVAAVPGGSTPNPIGTPGLTKVSDQELKELRELTQLSHLSYCGTELLDAGSFKCNICNGPASNFTQYQPILSSDQNATQGYVAVDIPKKTIYLSFQGAVVTANWISSTNFPRTNLNMAGADPNAAVHQGFQDAYESNNVQPQIREKVTALIQQFPDFSLHALGHSYGCAISTLAVADLVLSKRIPANKVSLTTFGAPRIGNFEFARMIDTTFGLASVRRVTHSTDRISRVPPTPTGYRHAGTEMYVDVDGQQMLSCMDIDKGLDESPSCNNRFGVADLTIAAHQSFFDRLQDSACRVEDPLVPFVVRYLPFEILKNRT
ncbi:hypothetical protein HDU67_009476 [Dinochytrium kinnereticum]|nr:hypothetical protein HDU67_009476 [Dinochytrium kinnereticum]